jgi:hypothetical protein
VLLRHLDEHLHGLLRGRYRRGAVGGPGKVEERKRYG